MHGRGGAGSLVCGLWAPGDPQFECSLPVACGALSRATVEFPSCSWERNMESESKNEVEEGLKNPEVDQDLKAMETNEQLTNGNDPDPSNDSNAPLKLTLSEQIEITETTEELTNRSDISSDSQDAAELYIPKAGDATIYPSNGSVTVPTGEERAECDDSDLESLDLIIIEDKPEVVEISSDEEVVTTERPGRVCHRDSKYSEEKMAVNINEVIRGASESGDLSVYPAECAESSKPHLTVNKPERFKSLKTVTTNLSMKECFSRFLNEGMSVREAVGKVKELMRQEDKELQRASTNRTLSKREKQACQQFNRGQLKVYNLWRERGSDHQTAWAKVQLLKRFTKDGMPSAPSSRLVHSGPQPCKPSSAHISSGEFSGCRTTSFSPPATTNPVSRSQGNGPSLPQQAKNEPKSSLLPVSEPSELMHPNVGISLPPNSQNISSVPQYPPVTAFSGSTSALQAAVLINSFNSGSIVNSLITYLNATQLLPAIPSVPAPVPALSTHHKQEHVSEEDGAPKRSRFKEPSTNPVKTASGQSKRKKDPSSSANPLHVCIVPSEYPKERLSDDQMDAIENSILEAILEIDDESMKPIFEGSFRKKGRYEIVCQNILAKTWLDKYSSCMYEPWPNASLKIIPAEPESEISANVSLPLCKNDDNDKILRYIAKQNAGLNTHLWEVVLRSDGDANTSLSLKIDEESAKILRNNSKINFKVGMADIELLKDLKAKRHRESSNHSSNRKEKTFAKMGNSATARGSGSSVNGRCRADELVSSGSSSSRSRHKKRRNDPQDKRHHRFKKPAEILKNEGKINYKMKVTADIKVTEDLKAKHRQSSALSSNKSGSSQGSGASVRSSHGGGRADKFVSSSSSAGSLRMEHGMIPQDKHHSGLGESSRLDRHMKPPRYHQPYDTPSNRNSELYEPGYSLSSSYDRRESRVSGMQYESVDRSWSSPSCPRQYREEISEPKFWHSRSQRPEYSHPRYVKSHGVPRQPLDEPMVPGSSYSTREPSKYIELSHPTQSPSDHYFQVRHAREMSTGRHNSRSGSPKYRSSSDGLAYAARLASSRPYPTSSHDRSPSNEYFQERRAPWESTMGHTSTRSPSPEYRSCGDRSAYSEILGSSRSYCTGSEPTAHSKLTTIENSWQVRTQQRVCVRSQDLALNRCSTRSKLPQQSASSGGHTERDHSPLGSSYLPRPEH